MTREQKGHWKSENTTMVTSASAELHELLTEIEAYPGGDIEESDLGRVAVPLVIDGPDGHYVWTSTPKSQGE